MTLCRRTASVGSRVRRRENGCAASSASPNARRPAAHQRRTRPNAPLPAASAAANRPRAAYASEVVHAAGRSDAPRRALDATCAEAAVAADGTGHAPAHLGVIHGADAAGRVARRIAVSATAHVHHRRRARTAAAPRGGREAAGSEGVEDVEHEGVLLGGEVEHPDDVDHCEDEPASGHGVEGRRAAEDALVHAEDGEDDGYRTERRNLEAVHGDRVRGEGVEDPEDEEKLEEYREP